MTRCSQQNPRFLLCLGSAFLFLLFSWFHSDLSELAGDWASHADTYAGLFFFAALVLLVRLSFVLIGPPVVGYILVSAFREKRMIFALPIALVIPAAIGYVDSTVTFLQGFIGSGQLTIFGIRI